MSENFIVSSTNTKYVRNKNKYKKKVQASKKINVVELNTEVNKTSDTQNSNIYVPPALKNKANTNVKTLNNKIFGTDIYVSGDSPSNSNKTANIWNQISNDYVPLNRRNQNSKKNKNISKKDDSNSNTNIWGNKNTNTSFDPNLRKKRNKKLPSDDDIDDDLFKFYAKKSDKGNTSSVITLKRRRRFNDEFPHEMLWKKMKLNNDDKKTYLSNPHLRGIFSTQTLPPVIDREFVKEDRILKYNQECAPYRRRTNDWKTQDHWGQRKLLLTEMEFLTKYSKENDVILYVGAGPGSHIKQLSELFPTCYFIIYDLTPFHLDDDNDMIEKYQKYFTIEDAKSIAEDYKDSDIIFISDIRTNDQSLDSDVKVNDDIIRKDLKNQLKWIKIMKDVIRVASLKFRLPYTDDREDDDINKNKFKYLDGKIYYQIWEAPTSAESRLIVTDFDKYRNYDINYYGNNLFNFNVYTRSTKFKIDKCILNLCLGYDHCYDCSCEIYIIKKYIKKFYPEYPILDKIREIHNKINLCSTYSGSIKNCRNSLLLENDIFFHEDLRKKCGMHPKCNRFKID